MADQAIVMKFGGTSVEDARAFARVARIVGARSGECPAIVVVVSAMSRVTDALLASVERALEGDAAAAARALEEHFERYTLVALMLQAGARDEFFVELSNARRALEELFSRVAAQAQNRAALQDQIVSYGECLSARLLAAVLSERGLPAAYVDARRCVITNAEHGNATPLNEETYKHTRAELSPLLEAGRIPVLGGFIGATPEGHTTTLGRGGSDYSAALVGAGLEAREIQIWTDVNGVLTADPRVVPHARTIPSLSFAEAAELAYFGAKVLHPKTILPAVIRSIPVRICNSRDPDQPGTGVYFDAEMSPRTVKAIAHKKGVTVLHITSARMLGAYGFLRALFEVFERHRTIIDIVTTSEVSVSLSLEDTSKVEEIIRDLRPIAAVKVETGLAVVCVVGEELRYTSGIAARIFGTLGDINVLLISQGASNVNLTFVVAERDVEETVRRLHASLFECDTQELAPLFQRRKEGVSR
ncbi:MAG TPA: lysine-sensitive aspartokinase 3 [Pyrinomonadaceae bacterium]|nr:lysine-sensitive aspartokinase 3 [Pyrinomonadaceae bacterium]